jgi:sulfur-oxidizing protein SoxB
LEDVADNVFHSDPYLRQGGDMVRVGGMTYAIAPRARIGARISEMRIRGTPMEAGKRYKVAGWAPVAAPVPAQLSEGAGGEPIWDVMARYLRSQRSIPPRRVNQPRLLGVKDNPGIS